MKIKEEFISNKGVTYHGVREIAFSKNNYYGNLGNMVAETKREDNLFFGVDSMDFDTTGVYIFQTNYDKTKALRLYKCFLEKSFNGDKDDILISKLQELQNNVKLTKFPNGVVTLDGRIIGQEIPYYENYKTLIEILDKLDPKQLLEVSKKSLIIIKELYDSGINYLDVHAKNFMINDNLDVKLIDFENDLVTFERRGYKDLLLKRYYSMINLISKNSGKIDEYELPGSFSEAFDNLKTLEKKIK